MPILLTLAPILLKYAPDLIGMIFGHGAGDSADRVVNTVKDIFGTTEPEKVEAQIAADPTKADELLTRLNAETEQLKANIENDKDARATTVELAKAGSPIAWAPIVVSFLVVAGFLGTICAFFTLKTTISDTSGQVLLLLIGALIQAFGQVINYWLGSSASSQRNGDAIRDIARNIPVKAATTVIAPAVRRK